MSSSLLRITPIRSQPVRVAPGLYICSMRCELCSKPLNERQTRWCSKRCNYRARWTWRVAPFVCPSCGVRVLIPANKLAGRKYCNRSCAARTFNTKFALGERNPNWRGGTAMPYGAGWKRIREHVRARDRVCSRCGKTPVENGRALDVHHLEPFRFSGDNSLDKLIALCRSCHMRADDHGRKGSAAFLREAGYRIDVTKREIRRRVARERAEQRARDRREARAHALELAELGLSLRRIARAVRVSHQTIANWLPARQDRLVS